MASLRSAAPMRSRALAMCFSTVFGESPTRWAISLLVKLWSMNRTHSRSRGVKQAQAAARSCGASSFRAASSVIGGSAASVCKL